MDFKADPITDGFSREVELAPQRFTATNFAGLLPIQFHCARIGLWTPFTRVMEKHCPAKERDRFTAEQLFRQRVLGHVCGFEDLTDHDLLGEDPGFISALGAARCASGSTLCRFENSVSRHAIDDLNKALFEGLLIINKSYRIFPRADNGTHPVLILDVDSTHIDLYGDQEKKSYNAHYQTSCLAPVLCFLDGWPLAVYNAAGTEDGRKILEHQLERLIKTIKRAFPKHRLLLRADSGFNSKKIVKICEDTDVCYVTGLSPNKRSQALARKGLADIKRKLKKRYTTQGKAWRTLGELVGYKAKSWEKGRRVIARKQHDPRTNQLDLRLIQTNIVKGAKFGETGYCGQYSSFNSERLYEVLYCGRARDCELQIGLFKSACFGARASSTRFLTNSYRMILGAVCLLVLKLMTFIRYKSAEKQHNLRDRKPVEMSIARLRSRVICVTAQVHQNETKLILTLPSVGCDELTLKILMKVPIP